MRIQKDRQRGANPFPSFSAFGKLRAIMTTGSQDTPPRPPNRAELGESTFRGHGGRRPRALAYGGHGDKHIALDDRYIYWTDLADGTVTRLPKDGGVPLVIATDQARPCGLVLNGDHLYWATYHHYRPEKGTIVRMPKEGGDVQLIASGQAFPQCIAVSGREVYWGNHGDGNLGSVVRGTIDGGAPVTLATKQKRPCAIVLDDQNIYWANEGNKRPSYFTDGSLMRMSRAAENKKRWIVAKNQSMPTSLLIHEGTLYWTVAAMIHFSHGPGSIQRRPLSGGKTVNLVEWMEEAGHLAVDAKHVFWLSRWSGRMFRIPLHGGEPEQLLSTEDLHVGVPDFAADETSVYWTAYNSQTAGGAVWKMAKG